MDMVIMVAESIFLIFGSLVTAILLCMLLWRVLLLVRCPEYGALLIVALVIITLAVPLTHSQFLRMTLLFAMAGAIPFWIAGREWRSSTKGSMQMPTRKRAH